MAKGKRLICPPVVIARSEVTKFALTAKAWESIGQILAHILAKAIKTNEAEKQCGENPEEEIGMIAD